MQDVVVKPITCPKCGAVNNDYITNGLTCINCEADLSGRAEDRGGK
jgi:hypothetical protein